MDGRSALEGIRILDFTWVLAGPYATRILADFGAEVIKVQPLTGGEEINGYTKGYYDTWNRNKLGVALDLNKPQGIEIAKRLIQASDVVVENFSPRVMANWGLDYDSLKLIKPDIIMVSLSALGQTGPWRDYVGFGPTIQAFSGITQLTTIPGHPPLGLGYSYADHVGGLFAVIAILEALEHRRCSGEGQYIDISQLEAMCSLLDTALLDYLVNSRVASPVGNHSSQAAPHGVYRCRGGDRWCAIAVFTDEEWQAFCEVLGNPSWTREERFATVAERLRNVAELDQLVAEWTKQRTAEEVMTLLQRVGVAVGVVQDARDVAKDPQLRERGFFIGEGETRMDGTPIKLSATSARFDRPAPALGQDTDYVLRQLLGISEEEIARYREEGIIKGSAQLGGPGWHLGQK